MFREGAAVAQADQGQQAHHLQGRSGRNHGHAQGPEETNNCPAAELPSNSHFFPYGCGQVPGTAEGDACAFSTC